MKLTLEYGQDHFAWDNDHRPMDWRGRRTGPHLWLDGELVQAVAEQEQEQGIYDGPATLLWRELMAGKTPKRIYEFYRQFPHFLPEGIEL